MRRKRTFKPKKHLKKKNLLGVPYEHQRRTEWCWAACAVMVLEYYGHGKIKKCQIVAEVIPDCCQNYQEDRCNQPCGWLDVQKIYTANGVNSQSIKTALPFDKIKDEINAKRPIEVGLASGSSRHLIIIKGYEVKEQGVNSTQARQGQTTLRASDQWCLRDYCRARRAPRRWRSSIN